MNLTIVTSFYNGYERFIPRWIDSINNLTIKPTAIVVIASGPHNLKTISTSIPLKFIQLSKHISMGHARNIAVKNAKTEWVMYLDTDDLILPNAIENLEKYINKTDVICGGLKYEGKRGNKSKIFTNASRENILKGDCCCCSHAVFKKKFWEQTPYKEDNEFCDGLLWVGFALLGAEFLATEELITVYKTHRASHSFLANKEDLLKARERKAKYGTTGKYKN